MTRCAIVLLKDSIGDGIIVDSDKRLPRIRLCDFVLRRLALLSAQHESTSLPAISFEGGNIRDTISSSCGYRFSASSVSETAFAARCTGPRLSVAPPDDFAGTVAVAGAGTGAGGAERCCSGVTKAELLPYLGTGVRSSAGRSGYGLAPPPAPGAVGVGVENIPVRRCCDGEVSNGGGMTACARLAVGRFA